MFSSFLVREAMRLLTRDKRLNAISLGAMSMSLLALGLVLLLQLGIFQAAHLVEAKVEIVAFLDDRLAPAATQTFLEHVAAYPGVAGVDYTSKDQAVQEFAADPDLKKFLDVLGTNPLPAAVRVRLREKTPDGVANFVSWLNAQSGVSETSYGGGDADRLLKFLRLVRLGALLLTGSLTLAAVVIIGNIISLMVFSRREEINIMRLVGATAWFIRGPFLLWGAVQGAAGGLVASGLLFGLWRLLVYTAWTDVGIEVTGLLPPRAGELAALGALALAGTGALLGLIGSLMSIGRQLREQ